MKPKHKQNCVKRSLSVAFFFILSVLVVKGALGLGLLTFSGDKHFSWFSAREVMAQEQKSKKDAAAPNDVKAAPSVAPSAQVNSGPHVALADTATSSADKISVLEKREMELMRRERDLQQKEEYIKKMEQDVQKKFEALSGIQKEIQNYRAERESQKSAKIKSLVKIYESMKSKEAAKLLENLDEQLVVVVISNMNTEAAANILAVMETKKGAKISQVLSTP